VLHADEQGVLLAAGGLLGQGDGREGGEGDNNGGVARRQHGESPSRWGEPDVTSVPVTVTAAEGASSGILGGFRDGTSLALAPLRLATASPQVGGPVFSPVHRAESHGNERGDALTPRPL